MTLHFFDKDSLNLVIEKCTYFYILWYVPRYVGLDTLIIINYCQITEQFTV